MDTIAGDSPWYHIIFRTFFNSKLAFTPVKSTPNLTTNDNIKKRQQSRVYIKKDHLNMTAGKTEHPC